jgi:hypothetical protein
MWNFKEPELSGARCQVLFNGDLFSAGLGSLIISCSGLKRLKISGVSTFGES